MSSGVSRGGLVSCASGTKVVVVRVLGEVLKALPCLAEEAGFSAMTMMFVSSETRRLSKVV